MPVTARDIARELNLSQPTVSRILNGDRRHRISAATRQRVLDAASRLQYQPNAVARSLRRGRTNVVGLYTSHDYDARNPFFGTIIGSLQRACDQHDVDLLLHGSYGDRTTDEIHGKLRDGRTDGLILHADSSDNLIQRLVQSALPVVAVADALPGIPAVTCDDSDGMRQLIDYLWSCGYRHFTCLLPCPAAAFTRRRRELFLQSLQKYGIVAHETVTLYNDGQNVGSALDDLLSLGHHTVVCCWNDHSAYNLLQVCLARGVHVPQDLAIAGFDGFRDTVVPARELTTIHCPWDRVAATALEALVARIAGTSSIPAETRLPVTLLPGDTA